MNTKKFNEGDFICKSETKNLNKIYQIATENSNIASCHKCIFNAEKDEITFEMIEISKENEVSPRYTPARYLLNLINYELVEIIFKNEGFKIKSIAFS